MVENITVECIGSLYGKMKHFKIKDITVGLQV